MDGNAISTIFGNLVERFVPSDAILWFAGLES
jgi:hypothetical protein